MLQFKEGVSIKLNNNPFLLYALTIVEKVYESRGNRIATITSGNDSQHMKESLHYKNRAFDVRTKDVPNAVVMQIFNDLKTILNSDGYDVLHENPGTDNEHIHIEFDPRK